jgi:hypothetical protein
MPSAAVVSLRAAVQEVAILQAANPSPTGSAPQKPDLTRVIGRACVVLLSSHFERYIYAVNEEAVDRIRNSGAHSSMIPLDIRFNTVGNRSTNWELRSGSNADRALRPYPLRKLPCGSSTELVRNYNRIGCLPGCGHPSAARSYAITVCGGSPISSRL